MRVIFNADDFGRSPEINEAVILAHRYGVLTSASLMVTGDACREAVDLAREHPGLAVGLHLVLADGRAALPPERIPHLADADGRFRASAARAGLAYYLNSAARGELAAEIAAQFDLFARTGLPMSHVDGHCHLHLHPVVLPLLLPLALRHGARGIRLPRDDHRLAARHDPRHALRKTSRAFVHALLCRWGSRRIPAGLTTVDRVYGLCQSGEMGADYVRLVLQHLEVPTAELYFHPATIDMEPLGPNRRDLAALLSPSVREALEKRGLRPATYYTLREE